MQLYQRILIPIDGTARGEHAVSEGLQLAARLGSSVTGLFVVDVALFTAVPAELAMETTRESLHEEGRAVLSRTEARARALGVPWKSVVLEGHPSEEIVRHAGDADLVVLGTWGHKGLAHLLFGSTAEKVIRHAPCPVLVVRASEEADGPARSA